MYWLLLLTPSVLFPFAGAALVTVINRKDPTDWWCHVKLPAPKPPDWVFGPVLIPLYILAGVSTFLVLTSDCFVNPATCGVTLGAYVVMMVLNWITMPRLLNIHGFIRRRFSLLLQTATLLPKSRSGSGGPGTLSNVHPRSIVNDGIILWTVTLAVIVLYSATSMLAGLLMVPHLVWTTAAVALCYADESTNNNSVGFDDDMDNWGNCKVKVCPSNDRKSYSELQ